MTSSAPFKPSLRRAQTLVGGSEPTAPSRASEGSGLESEQQAVASRAAGDTDDALRCAQLELQVCSAALAVLARALRRSQQINSELRSREKQAPETSDDTMDIVAGVADELTSMPPGPPAASLLPIFMEQAIRETDAFNRAFYLASMAAPPRLNSPDLSQFSQQSSQHSVDSPRSDRSSSAPAAFASFADSRDHSLLDAAPPPLPPLQQFMWDVVLWPSVAAKIDAISAKSFIIELLLDSAMQSCAARPYPASSCITLPIWIDTAEHPALSRLILSHVIQPLQTLAAMAGLGLRVAASLGAPWARIAAGRASAHSALSCPFWDSHHTWGVLPLSHLAANAAEPAALSVTVLGQRLIHPLPFSPPALGLIRRYNLAAAPSSYHEASILSLPSHQPIDVPRISCIISPPDDGGIGALQRSLLLGDAIRAEESQLAAAAAAAASGDWSLQQSPLQWLTAFQLKKRFLRASKAADSCHAVLPLVGHAGIISAMQQRIIQQLFVWFPNLRQAAASLASSHKGSIKSAILRQMYQPPFLLLSDPFAFHRGISQLQVEQLPSPFLAPATTRWVSCKDFTGSAGALCCDHSWYRSGRQDAAKDPLLRPFPPCYGDAAAAAASAQGGGWQLQATQLLLNSLALCVGREAEQRLVVELFKSLSASLASRAVSHPTFACVCGLKGAGKTTLIAACHRRFSNASSENFAPVEAVFLCDEVLEPISSADDFWAALSASIVRALADVGLASVAAAEAPAATANLADVAREACSKRAVVVVIDVALPQLCDFLSASPPSIFRLPQLPGFMIIFTTTAQLTSQRDPQSVALQSLCEQRRAPFIELPMLDSRAALSLASSEISRFYHVAGRAQPSDADSLGFSLHQFMQSVPVMGCHPLWIKAACRCACLLPNEWQTRLSGHSGRIAALLAAAAPQGQPSSRTDRAALTPHPPATPFKPNLASSLKATAERWKREGFDLFEKSSTSALSADRALSGSKAVQAAAQAAPAHSSAAASSPGGASRPTDRCSAILQDIFDVLIAAAAASLHSDSTGELIAGPSAPAASAADCAPRGFVSNMLHLASSCGCPVPLYSLSAACSAAPGAVDCISWLLHEVILLNAAGCLFVLRSSLLPQLPPSFNSLNLSLSLAVELGHSVAAWSSAVEGALVGDEDFFRTQCRRAPSPSPSLEQRQRQRSPPHAAQHPQPIECLWFSLCAGDAQGGEHVLQPAAHSAFALHSLLNCLACARLGGLLQQWLMTPACALLLGSSEMSRASTKRLWSQSHELGSPSAAAALMAHTKRWRGCGASAPALLSLLAAAHNYRLLQMNDEASDVFDCAAAVSTQLFGSASALSCRLLICAAMCHRLAKRYVAAKERLSAACCHSASGDTGRDSAVMAAAVEIQVSAFCSSTCSGRPAPPRARVTRLSPQGIVERDQGFFERSMILLQVSARAAPQQQLSTLLQGAVVLKESVAYGRMLLQSLLSPERNTPHIARYAVLLANSLGAEPYLTANLLGVTHLVQRAGGNPEMLQAISGLVVEAACALCIKDAAVAAANSSPAPQAAAFSAVALNLNDRDSSVERLLSAAIVIAGSGSRGIVDHDAAAGVAMLSLAVRVSRTDSRRSEAISIAERGCSVLVAALGTKHPSAGSAVELVDKLRGSLHTRTPDWLLNDSIWRR